MSQWWQEEGKQEGRGYNDTELLDHVAHWTAKVGAVSGKIFGKDMKKFAALL